jgi:hypothetical protein
MPIELDNHVGACHRPTAHGAQMGVTTHQNCQHLKWVRTMAKSPILATLPCTMDVNLQQVFYTNTRLIA